MALSYKKCGDQGLRCLPTDKARMAAALERLYEAPVQADVTGRGLYLASQDPKEIVYVLSYFDNLPGKSGHVRVKLEWKLKTYEVLMDAGDGYENAHPYRISLSGSPSTNGFSRGRQPQPAQPSNALLVQHIAHQWHRARPAALEEDPYNNVEESLYNNEDEGLYNNN